MRVSTPTMPDGISRRAGYHYAGGTMTQGGMTGIPQMTSCSTTVSLSMKAFCVVVTRTNAFRSKSFETLIISVSRGTYSKGTPRVLLGYSKGTPRVLQGYS